MKKNIKSIVFFLLWAFVVNAQQINKVEYFFDTDPGFGQGTNVAISPNATINNFNFTADVTGLSSGFHFLYVRSRDNNSKWSETAVKVIYINPPISTQAGVGNITKLEYFIDADPGFGAARNVPISANTNLSNFTFSADLTGLASGFHSLYVRSQDDVGKWSEVAHRIFYVNPPTTGQSPVGTITKLEYFIDTDPGFGVARNVPITPNTNLSNFSFNADLSGLTSGFHYLYVRSQDNAGKWSEVASRVFYVNPQSIVQPTAPDLKLIEYFVNTDPGFGNGTKIMLPANTKDLNGYSFNANLTNLAATDNKIYFRTQDVTGKWSETHAMILTLPSTSSNSGGKFGKAFNFNGLNQYAATPNGMLNGAQTFTIEFFVKTKECRNNGTFWQRRSLIGTASGGCNSGDFGINTNNGYIGEWGGLVTTNCDREFLSNITQINDGQWHHVAAVNDGAMVKLYVDGVYQGEIEAGTALATNNGAPFWIGGLGNNAGYDYKQFFHEGLFDEIRFSNSIRYTNNFTPPSSAFSTDANTVALYHCEDDDCTNLDDASGNNNHAALANQECSTDLCGSYNTGKSINLQNNYVLVGNMGTFPDKGTLTLWQKQSEFSGIPNSFSTTCLSGCNNGIRIENYNGLGCVMGNDAGTFGGGVLIPSNQYQINKWYHIALSWDKTAGTLKGYANGVLSFSLTGYTTFPTQFHDVKIGIGYDGGRSWNGNIDEVTLWQKELSLVEIQAAMSSINKNDTDLLAYWSFDANSTTGNGVTLLNESVATAGSYNGTTTGGTCISPSFDKSTIPTSNSSQTITISGTPTICSGSSADLTVSFNGGAPPYAFSYSDGTTTFNVNTNNNPYILTVTPIATTTYNLVNATGLSCAPQLFGSGVVTLNMAPALSSADVTICGGAAVDLSTTISDANNTTGNLYYFNTLTDAQNQTAGISPNVSPTVTTTYYVRKNNQNNACFDIEDVTVTVGSNAAVNVGTDKTICAGVGTSVSLQATISGTATQLTWSGGAGIFSNPNDLTTTYTPTATEITNGSVTITATTDDPPGACPAASDEMMLSIVSPNGGTIGNSQIVCSGNIPASFSSITGATALSFTYQWEMSTTDCDSGFSPIANQTGAQYYHNQVVTQNTYFRRKTIANYNGVICEAFSNCVSVTIGATMNVTTTINTPYLCDASNNNGSITVNVTNGTTPYQYATCIGNNCTNFGNNQSSNTFANLSVGTHTFRITDGSGCVSTMSATINGIETNVISKQDVLCYGASNGAVTISATNGVAPYTYNLSSSLHNNTGIFTGLSSGAYYPTVTDANGCKSLLQTIYIGQPNQLYLTGSQVALVNCTSLTSGIVDLNAYWGTPPYSYKVDGEAFQSSNSISGLTVGNYIFTVKDANDCETTFSLNVKGYEASIGGDLSICNGETTVLETIRNTNGLSQFLWNTGATTQTIDAQPSSNTVYSVTLTNPFNGCSITATAELSVTPNPTVTLLNVNGLTCAIGGTASATATANGGSAPYNYAWSNNTYNGTISGIGVGSYQVTATDANGCKGTTSFNVTPYTNPATITPSAVAPLNSNYFYPGAGDPNQVFRFAFTFTHPQNKKPKEGYPRLLMDYEGTGNYTDVFDRAALMLGSNYFDTNTSDGKVYETTIFGLLNSTNWRAKFVVVDENDCTTEYEFDGPDVTLQPNLAIFADDISFNPKKPNPGDTISVFAKIHNNSDYAIGATVAHLRNEFSGETYYDINVPTMPSHSEKTIEWRIVTPSVPSFNPMHVFIDWANTITEGNELDNHAVRPFTNGNYNLPGGINVSVQPNPPTFCIGELLNDYEDKIRLYLSGTANYYGLAVPLANPSVAGADVKITIVETGQTFTGFTDGSGGVYFAIRPPKAVGIYHITGEITDYTLESTFTAQFEVAACPGYVPPVRPDLVGKIKLAAPFGDFDEDGLYEYLVTQNAPVSGFVEVKNQGTASSGASFSVKHFTLTGTPSQMDYTVPMLDINQIHNITLPGITYNSVGTQYLYAFTDSQFGIVENFEDNNSDFVRIKVVPASTDIEFGDLFVSNTSTDLCTKSKIIATFKNKGNQNTGIFDVRLKIKDANNTVILTALRQARSIPFYEKDTLEFTYQFNQGGNYTFEIESDYNNLIVESNESNNNGTAVRSVNVAPCRPNLTFSNFCSNIILDPVNPTNLPNVDVGIYLYNYGNAAVVNPEIRVMVTGSSNFTTTWTHNGTILPNQSVFVHVSVPKPSGNSSVQFMADPNNLIAEAKENDNLSVAEAFCWEFNFGASSCGAGRFCPDPYGNCPDMWYENVLVNLPVKPYIGIVNNGRLFGSNVKLKFEVKGNGFGNGVDWFDLGNAFSDQSPSCFTCPSMVELPTPISFISDGAYSMRFTIDPNGEYSECDESNNQLIINFNVSNAADLFVRSSRIDLEKLHPDVGETVQWVRVSYENLGASNVQDTFKLKLLIDGIPVDSQRVPGLIYQGYATRQFNVNWSSTLPGIHIVRAIVDADNQVMEIREDNNEATRSFVVGEAPDLIVKTFTSSNMNPATNEVVSLGFQINNQGDFDANAIFQLFYKDDNNVEIPITSRSIFVQDNDSISFTIPWAVLDPSTILIARIVNADPTEARTDNNENALTFNGVSVAVATTPVNCSSPTSGKATANPVGGNPPYTYTWSNGSISKNASGFAIGTHSVTVEDAVGQVNSVMFTITNETPVSATFSQISEIKCFAGTGYVRAAGANGTSPYQYSWSSGSTYDLADLLLAGTYTVTVTDKNGCTATNSITLTEPPLLTASAVHQDVLCTGGNSGSITVTAMGGTPPLNYHWTNQVSLTNIATNLPFGLFNVSVTDANNCYTTTGAIILEPLPFQAKDSTFTTGCKSIAYFNPVGATPHPINGYTLSFNGSIYNGLHFEIPNLASGTYPYTFTDANDCKNVGSLTINSTLIISAGADVTLCSGIVHTLQASSNLVNPTYVWSPNANLGTPNAISTTLTVTQTQVYTVSISNTNGCAGTAMVKVTMLPIGVANFIMDYEDKTVSFINTSTRKNGASWDFGDGVTSTVPNPVHTYATYGNYVVKLTSTDSCGLVSIKYDTAKVIKYVAIRPKVILQGAYNDTTGIMDNYFDYTNLLPNNEPYTNLGYIHTAGGGGEVANNSVLRTPNLNVVDWIVVELRDTVSPATVLASRAALLLDDGNIVDLDGIKPVKFKYMEHRNYNVAIRHHNHLGIRTASKLFLSASPAKIVDFRSASLSIGSEYVLFGLNKAMITGDANFDGSIDAFDSVIWEGDNGLFDDYSLNADYNLDGSVDAFDSVIWELNNGRFEILD